MSNVIQIRQQEQAKFRCSACGAERGCDCNAAAIPAIEELARRKEQTRQRTKRAREKTKQKQRSGSATQEPGRFAHLTEAQAMRQLFLEDMVREEDDYYEYRGPVDQEVIDAVRKVATAWAKLLAKLERKYNEQISC